MEAALEMLLESGTLPRAEQVRDLVQPACPVVPHLAVPVVELGSYDGLLEEMVA